MESLGTSTVECSIISFTKTPTIDDFNSYVTFIGLHTESRQEGGDRRLHTAPSYDFTREAAKKAGTLLDAKRTTKLARKPAPDRREGVGGFYTSHRYPGILQKCKHPTRISSWILLVVYVCAGEWRWRARQARRV